jgi:hypothetical protein
MGTSCIYLKKVYNQYRLTTEKRWMNLVGEWRKPAEGAKLSGAVKSGTIRGHDSGESRRKMRHICSFPRAPKVHGSRYASLSLRQKDREKYRMLPVILLYKLISGAVGDKFFILYTWRRYRVSGIAE